MIIADVIVQRSSAAVKMYDMLPRGASGLKVKFRFADTVWENLSKTAVFRNGSTTIDAVIIDNCATIPHEMLTKVMDVVEAGIYGTDSGRSLVIPTIWTKLGTVTGAANPSGEIASVPTLPYWAQIKEQVDVLQNTMMNQEDLTDALIQAKQSGEFDGPQGEKGEKGERGEQGIPGIDGKDGHSPKVGIDYWTDTDKESIVTQAVHYTINAIQTSSDIVCEQEGTVCTLADASNRGLMGLSIYGKTTQNGTPSPDSAVNLESVGDGGTITVKIGASKVDENPQTLTVQTPNGLPGIPVTSGGNYTDENGQQWVCDEVDFARGKYVQRVVKCGIDFFKAVGFSVDVAWYNADTSHSYELKATQKQLQNNFFTSLCNVLTPLSFAAFYNKGVVEGVMNEHSYLVVNLDKSRGIDTVEKFTAWCNEVGFEVIKPLATPIETDLTADEIAAYSALHTNCPNTTVYNDAGAEMSVKYVADTKLYIDNKFAELATSIVNNV